MSNHLSLSLSLPYISLNTLSLSVSFSCDRCELRLSAQQLERLLDRIDDELEAIDVHDIPALENFLVR